MPYNTHRSATTYSTDFGNSIRTFGSRSEMITLFSTLLSGALAAMAKQQLRKTTMIMNFGMGIFSATVDSISRTNCFCVGFIVQPDDGRQSEFPIFHPDFACNTTKHAFRACDKRWALFRTVHPSIPIHRYAGARSAET